MTNKILQEHNEALLDNVTRLQKENYKLKTNQAKLVEACKLAGNLLDNNWQDKFGCVRDILQQAIKDCEG